MATHTARKALFSPWKVRHAHPLFRRSVAPRAIAGMLVLAVLASPSGVAASPRQAAACTFEGLIELDSLWTPASCASYLVGGTIVVASYTTLTIAPGTVIRFAPGTALQVQGTLVAMGTEEQPIRFQSNQTPPQRGDWAGMELLGQGATYDSTGGYLGGTVLEHVEIRHAGGGTDGAVVIHGGAPSIAHSVIEDNAGNGVFRAWDRSGTAPTALRIHHSRISRNGANGVAVYFDDLTLHDNEITANGSRGLYLNSGNISRVEFERNVVRFNGDGGLYLAFGFDGIFRDNVITHNRVGSASDAGVAINSPFLETAIIANNDLHDNRTADGQAVDLRNTGAADIIVEMNWWGTTDRGLIHAHIVDQLDGPFGLADFEPYLAAPNGRVLPLIRLFLPSLELAR